MEITEDGEVQFKLDVGSFDWILLEKIVGVHCQRGVESQGLDLIRGGIRWCSCDEDGRESSSRSR